MEETDEYDELKEKFEQLCESNELLMNENAVCFNTKSLFYYYFVQLLQ